MFISLGAIALAVTDLHSLSFFLLLKRIYYKFLFWHQFMEVKFALTKVTKEASFWLFSRNVALCSLMVDDKLKKKNPTGPMIVSSSSDSSFSFSTSQLTICQCALTHPNTSVHEAEPPGSTRISRGRAASDAYGDMVSSLQHELLMSVRRALSSTDNPGDELGS